MHGKNSFKLAFGASEMKTTDSYMYMHTHVITFTMAIKITIKGK
jgi:hypothetical protein